MQTVAAVTARWRPATARTVRDALAAIGAVAHDAVLHGAAPMRADTALLTQTAARPLEALGLDRASHIVDGLRAWVGTPSGPYVRELLRALLVSRMARRFPDGPAPLAVLEPLLRSRRPLHEQALHRGRVLSPLYATRDELLAWDVAAARVIRVDAPQLMGEDALHIRSMRLDPGYPTPLAHPGHVTRGVKAASCDRRMLRHAEVSFRTVGLAHSAELGDPFPRDAAPVLVGPFRFVKRSSSGGLWATVEDASGQRASVRFPASGLDGLTESTRLHALVRPVARQGRLVLIPHVLWRDGQRSPGFAAQVTSIPWEDGVVAALGAHLLRVVTNGLDANYSVGAEVRRLVPHLAAAGFTRLARLAHETFDPTRVFDPLRFATAAHLTHAMLAGPRWIELGEAV